MLSCNNVVTIEKCKGKKGRSELKGQRLSPFEIGIMVRKGRKHGKKAHNQVNVIIHIPFIVIAILFFLP